MLIPLPIQKRNLREKKQTSGGGIPNTEEREHGGGKRYAASRAGKHKKPLCTAGEKTKNLNSWSTNMK